MTVDEFEARQILTPSPNSTPYTDPSDLADGLVIYFQEEVGGLIDFDTAALATADSHFAAHPPKLGLKRDFLLNDYIPTIGAFLGEVLVREGGGTWIVREPIMKSRVAIGERETDPFWIAHQAIFDCSNLQDAYNNIVNPPNNSFK